MHPVICSPDLAPHPTAAGWLQGWAVLMCTRSTWDLKSVRSQKADADRDAQELGSSYQVVWGYFRPSTQDFMHGHDIDSDALPLVA